LKKHKAKVKIWKLIAASQKHRQLMIDELNKTNLPYCDMSSDVCTPCFSL